MFPDRRRRPMGPYYPNPYQRRRVQGTQVPTRPNFLSPFQDQDGKMDYNRMFSTVQQMHGVYKQVSPLISMFMKR